MKRQHVDQEILHPNNEDAVPPDRQKRHIPRAHAQNAMGVI
jgi:hypothetical protein